MRMERTCLLLALLFGVLVHAQKKSLKPKWISGKALERVSRDFSDIIAFKNRLQPILKTRVPGTPGIAQVREYLEKELRNLNWHIEEDTFYSMTPYGNKSFTNIIATLDPSRPKRFVLAAHYDSKLYKEFEFIAATDSAVPCAILLDIAKQLNCLLTKAKAEKAKHITPQIVFFDGEEAFKEWTDTDSIYGARHLAEKWKNTPHPTEAGKSYLESIETLVLLDLIGSRDIQFRNFFDTTKPLYELLVKQEKLLADNNLLNPSGVHKRFPLFTPIHNNGFGYYGGIQDDHIPFLNKGVPILHLISAPFPHVWHTRDDNADAIDYDVTDNFNTIFRTFVASFLHLDPTHPLCRKKK